MTITVETTINAPVEQVWHAYTTPADIVQWNAASDDWHTPRASVDLRPGGAFLSRMEAKDGSMGFDFAGTYTKVVPHELIEYTFGDRTACIEFLPGAAGVTVRVSFDAETTHSVDQQRAGWQAILDNFKRHVEASAAANRTTVERASDRELVVTRTFDAPATRVFDAWTRPELLKQWWVPKSMGMSLLSVETDARTGGRYRLVFPHGDSTMEFFGRYTDVTPPARIEWTNEEGGENGSVTTVTLEERDGQTRLVMRERYPSKEALDAAGTGSADATVETFAQLDELLVKSPTA